MIERTKSRSKRPSTAKKREYISEVIEVNKAEKYAEEKVFDSEAKVFDSDAVVVDVINKNVLEIDHAMKLVSKADEEIAESIATFEEIVADAVVSMSQQTGEVTDVEIQIDDAIIEAELAIAQAIAQSANNVQVDSRLSYTKSLDAIKDSEKIVSKDDRRIEE